MQEHLHWQLLLAWWADLFCTPTVNPVGPGVISTHAFRRWTRDDFPPPPILHSAAPSFPLSVSSLLSEKPDPVLRWHYEATCRPAKINLCEGGAWQNGVTATLLCKLIKQINEEFRPKQGRFPSPLSRFLAHRWWVCAPRLLSDKHNQKHEKNKNLSVLL